VDKVSDKFASYVQSCHALVADVREAAGRRIDIRLFLQSVSPDGILIGRDGEDESNVRGRRKKRRSRRVKSKRSESRREGSAVCPSCCGVKSTNICR
jgi:hypothetical protein